MTTLIVWVIIVWLLAVLPIRLLRRRPPVVVVFVIPVQVQLRAAEDPNDADWQAWAAEIDRK